MAYESPGFTMTLVAATDLSANQFYFVKVDSNGKAAVCAAATDLPCGVLQNKPESGEEAEIMVTGISKVNSDAALTIGNNIGTAADGQADAKTGGTDTTEAIVGVVLVASAAAGGYAVATVNCLNPFVVA